LSNSIICGNRSPMNVHIGFFRLPALAHVAYWKDSTTLRFILSRVYGRKYLEDKGLKLHSAGWLTFLAVFGYTAWAAIILGVLYLIVFVLPGYAGEALRGWL